MKNALPPTNFLRAVAFTEEQTTNYLSGFIRQCRLAIVDVYEGQAHQSAGTCMGDCAQVPVSEAT